MVESGVDEERLKRLLAGALGEEASEVLDAQVYALQYGYDGFDIVADCMELSDSEDTHHFHFLLDIQFWTNPPPEPHYFDDDTMLIRRETVTDFGGEGVQDAVQGITNGTEPAPPVDMIEFRSVDDASSL